VEKRSDGPVPSEILVQIPTVDGPEEVVVHRDQVNEKGIEAGHIGDKGEMSLVELPRETVSGLWRVWVAKKLVAA
jgi:hypothetical protein